MLRRTILGALYLVYFHQAVSVCLKKETRKCRVLMTVVHRSRVVRVAQVDLLASLDPSDDFSADTIQVATSAVRHGARNVHPVDVDVSVDVGREVGAHEVGAEDVQTADGGCEEAGADVISIALVGLDDRQDEWTVSSGVYMVNTHCMKGDCPL